MPGIPKSHACAQCKRRSIKCSQDWPTCTECKRTKLVCPGPSQLVKFVSHHGHRANHRGGGSLSTKPSLTTPDDLSAANETAIAHSATERAQRPRGSHRDGIIVFQSSFRSVPKSMPSTDADGVAGRLAHHLDSSFERRMISDLMYLPYVPKYLDRNPSLRDSVDFLCSVWAAHRRQEPSIEFIKMPMYGKAIRSLSRTLQSDQAFTVETIASIVILQKTEDLFNPELKQFRHEQGLTTILTKVGPPPKGDMFHGSVVGEIYGLLIPFWIATGWQDILTRQPWGDAIIGFLGTYAYDNRLRSWLEDVQNDTNEACSRLAEVTQLKRVLKRPINEPRCSSSSRSLVISRITMLYDEIGKISDKMSKILLQWILSNIAKAKEETSNSHQKGTNRALFMGLPGQTPVFLLTLRLHILRQRYDWSVTNKFPNESALCIELGAFCDTLWEIIPHLRIVRLFAHDPLPSDEPDNGTSSMGKTHLLNIYAELESAKRLLFRNQKNACISIRGNKSLSG